MVKQGKKWFLIVGFLAGLTLSGCGEDTDETAADTENTGPPTTEDTGSETAAVASQEDYYLKASPEVQGGEWLIMPLTSNIAGDIEVMVSVGLVGQAPDDLAVGTSQRVPLRGGRGEAVLQLSDIPQGNYEVDATFYPRWGFGDGEKNLDIKESVASETHIIAITGSGESAKAYLEREEGQRWVMNNFFPGTPWEPETFRTRFGEWEEFPATKRNPAIIKNYYFPSLDMTIVVNDLKGEVATWGMGREGL